LYGISCRDRAEVAGKTTRRHDLPTVAVCGCEPIQGRDQEVATEGSDSVDEQLVEAGER